MNRGRRVDAMKFLDEFQIYAIRYLDRVHDTNLLDEIISQYLETHPPSSGLGSREFFEGKAFPILPPIAI